MLSMTTTLPRHFESDSANNSNRINLTIVKRINKQNYKIFSMFKLIFNKSKLQYKIY